MTSPGSVTLLFTDLVGSTELAQRLGEDRAESFRRLHFGLLRTAVAEHGGREIKNLGDGLMVAFDAAPDALAAGIAVQDGVTAHNRSGVEPKFAVRIGIQAGDPVPDDGDYFGTSVIVAKRLCDRAAAGQILVGAEAASRAEGTFPLRPLGALDLKGLPEPVDAAELVWDPDGTARAAGPAPARPAHVVRPPSLTPPPDGFFGREAELGHLVDLLRDARLVSIIGPGGVGKTRLSGHLVDAVAPAYPDGVWCCALASVGADDDVSAAVATALRVERRAGVELTDRLVEFLAGKRALLVLDNCEQIVEGAADLAGAVLAGTSSVDVLVTSREALGIAGEHRVPLEPLGVEPSDDPRSEPPAVTLFLNRAAAAGRKPDASDLPAVRELCRRVDGLPLAIEIAAARVSTRTLAEIVADVTDRLADLSLRRGRAERHRSIHALVDWSYELLDEADRRLFERMAVFAGGADADAVAAVMGEERSRVVDLLGGLADQSLVVTRAHDGTTRYALLEPVRAYAAQRLGERGDEEAARDAHAGYFVSLAERAGAGVQESSDEHWLAIDRDLANLRATHVWALRRGHRDFALRLPGALVWHAWLTCVSEVHTWAEAAAGRFPEPADPVLALAWTSASVGAWFRGDLPHSVDLAERSVTMAGPDSPVARHGLLALASNLIFAGEFERAIELCTASENLSRCAGDDLVLVIARGLRAAALVHSGRGDEARQVADSMLAIAVDGGNAAVRAIAYYYAGEVRLDSDPLQAFALHEKAREEAEGGGNRFTAGAAGLSAVSVLARHGDPTAALARYPQLLDHWQRSGAWTQQWLTVRTLIEALARAGHSAHAAVLLGAASASATAPPVVGEDVVRLAAAADRLRETLGEAEMTVRQEQGARLDDAAALAYARDVLRDPRPVNVTLLFTDLVGSTELAQRLGEAAADEFRRLHFGLLRTAIAAHAGHEVKNLGDGLMVVFDDAPAAVAAAVAMQVAVAGHNRSGAEPRFAVRIGVQAGEPVLDDGDYFGTPVVVAKRLCDRAGPGQILVGTDAAAEAGDAHVQRPLGELELKGLSEAVPTVEVVWDPDGTARAAGPAPTRPAHIVRPPALAPPPDGFFGRETELDLLAGLLRDRRLVSIIGPGGVGKTRLSGHLVDAVAPGYPDGVWCCALASVGADDDVSAAVATALRVERRAGVDLADRVVDFLAGKRALLVLDNCEQIVDGAADLAAAVLAGTTAVDVLVTSREALGVPGEHRVPLEPLAVPRDGGDGAAPAVAMFVERAAAGGARPALADMPAVRELCRRVDGLPLAIELAAARAGARTLAEILADVTDRLADLSVRRGRAERHRSIHAVVDWSYELLDPPDRRLFERMAVFAGGADAEAVAAVAGLSLPAALDRLQALSDQSLVSTRAHEGATRFALLEPVRAYAELRLRERGDDPAARDAHARHFGELARRTDEGLRGADEIAWMQRLEQELANLRAAHGWLLERGDAEASLGLVGSLYWIVVNSGVSEMYAWAAQACERFPAGAGPAVAAAAATAGFGAWMSGDLDRAGDLGRRSVEAAGPDLAAARFGYEVLGVVATFRGDLGAAAALYRRSAECCRAAGDPLQLVNSLGSCALALGYAGRLEDAVRDADEALSLARTPTTLAWAHYCAGEIRLETATADAATYLERSLAEATRSNNRFILGAAGMSLVSVQIRLGNPAAALPHYPRLIDHWQRYGAWAQQWLTLRNLMEALAATGRPEPAAVLYGAMAASTTATPLVGGDAVRLADMLGAVTAELGAATLTEHQDRGAALGDAGALAYARDVLREILDEP